MKRSVLRGLWTVVGVVAFVVSVIAMVAGRLGVAVMFLVVCVVCLGTAMAISRRASRRR